MLAKTSFEIGSGHTTAKIVYESLVHAECHCGALSQPEDARSVREPAVPNRSNRDGGTKPQEPLRVTGHEQRDS